MIFSFSLFLFLFHKCDSPFETVSLYVMGILFHFHCVHCRSSLDLIKRSGNLKLYLDVLPPFVFSKWIYHISFVNGCKV